MSRCEGFSGSLELMIFDISYEIKICSVFLEARIMMKMSRSSKGVGQRCTNDKSDVKMFSGENHMDPGDVPAALSGLTLAEEFLISMVSLCINVHMLNHGGLVSSGHCVTFPQAVDERAKIYPRLQEEIDLIKVKKKLA